MSDIYRKCPFQSCDCNCNCPLSVWINKTEAVCAIAVIAVRGSDLGINSVPVKKDAS